MPNQNQMRVLITGANKGIGRALVGAVLAAREDTHVLLGSRDLARGEQARDAWVDTEPSWSTRITVLQLDVSTPSVFSAAEAVAAEFGREPAPLYGIINNAGVGFGNRSAQTVLNVNTYGPRRVCKAFLPLLDQKSGRIVNVSSASGPTFVSNCSAEHQKTLTDPEVTWDTIEMLMNAYLSLVIANTDPQTAGFGDSVYGFSKACLNAYTIALARTYPNVIINSCTPGFIETDMTRGFADARGVSPHEMGMKSPEAGTRSPLHLLFGKPGGSGWFFGSDAVRSPLDRYRSPGDPPYAPA